MMAQLMMAQFSTARTISLFASSLRVAGVLLALAVSPSLAQNQQPHQKNQSIYASLEKIPRKARIRKNPLESDPEAVAAGGKLFDLHCAECHGDMAQGGRKAPSLLADPVQQAAPGTLFWILTNGVVRRGMPVWSKLPEPQRWQLVSYIKSLTLPMAPLQEQKPLDKAQAESK